MQNFGQVSCLLWEQRQLAAIKFGVYTYLSLYGKCSEMEQCTVTGRVSNFILSFSNFRQVLQYESLTCGEAIKS